MAIAPGFSHSDNQQGTSFLEVPEVTKMPRQRSINLDDIYLTRYISPWARNPNANAATWRWWVFNEPISMICRETMIANIIGLSWEIAPRDSDQREELRGVIKHYSQLLENGGNNPELQLDWTGLVEWIVADLLDLPFGAGAEIGRKFDKPDGRVLWVKPLDGGTLYPTLNKDYPVLQMYSTYDIVTFPAHAISRVYMSPRTEILNAGWGLAPPEKAYFALRMSYQGDKYYADLISDTPPAGILDLMDVEWDDALKWVESLREFYMGSPSAMKIPVLAEHASEAKFIPFGNAPNNIMFDKITYKYAAIIASAYGMSLSDIGLQTTTAGGQTLAGSIRDERKTKRTGFARIKKKIKYWIESFLPPTLEFNFVDLDDELNVALGRARLATITALSQAQDKGVISAEEHRLILLGDGLFGVTTLPEKPPADAKEAVPASPFGNSKERPGMLGRPEAASSGGQGEVRKMQSVELQKTKYFDTHLKRFIRDITNKIGGVIQESREGLSDDELYLVRSLVDDSLFVEDSLGLLEILKSEWKNKRWFKVGTSGLADELEKLAIEKAETVLAQDYENSDEEYDLEDSLENAKNSLHNVNWDKIANEFSGILDENVKLFLGKSTVYLLKDILLSENGFDTGMEADDNNIVDEIYQSMLNNFDEFAMASINIETENLIDKIIKEIMK